MISAMAICRVFGVIVERLPFFLMTDPQDEPHFLHGIFLWEWDSKKDSDIKS